MKEPSNNSDVINGKDAERIVMMPILDCYGSNVLNNLNNKEVKNMEEQQEQNTNDWRKEVLDGPDPTLKIADGETKTFVFIGEGEKKPHPDFGTSIIFNIEFEGKNMDWYVSERNYSLLGQIKKLGSINGLAVKVSRTGARKSDTRYNIEKV